MKVLRWILFIPGSIIIAAIVQILYGFYPYPLVEDWLGERVARGSSGAIAAFILVLAGIVICPKRNKAIKNILAILVILIGTIITIGFYLKIDPNIMQVDPQIWQGAGMLTIGIVMIFSPVQDIIDGL
jgi:hypothetical protein